jgi:hypothetical protein
MSASVSAKVAICGEWYRAASSGVIRRGASYPSPRGPIAPLITSGPLSCSGTRDSGLGLGTQDSGLGLGTQDSGPRIRDSGPGISD